MCYDFITDDAYISFVYARNLAEFGVLEFNIGDRVEGYTNFLWTVLLAGMYWLGLPLEPVAKIFGSVFSIATLVVTFRIVESCLGKRGGWAYMAPALLCCCAGFACWASGGLETHMFTFFVCLAVFYYIQEQPRQFGRVAVVLALSAMTRPEGLLVAAVLGVHWLGCKTYHRSWRLQRGEWVAIVVFLSLWAPYFAWRYWYYGFVFPNTYYVKATGTMVGDYQAKLITQGFYYVWVWLKQSHLVFVLPVVCMGLLAKRAGRRTRFGSAALCLTIVYLAYTIQVGGDFMGLHRFILPLSVVTTIAFVLGVQWGTDRFTFLRRNKWAKISLGGAIVLAFALSQARLTLASTRWGNWSSERGIDTPVYLNAFARDRKAIGMHMHNCFLPADFSIVGGAGAQVYASRMRAVDVFGLVSKEIAHHAPRTRPRPGHNKWASNEMLLKYQPDFVFSCYSIHANPRKPLWNCNPSFWHQRGYEPVTLHIGCSDRVHSSHSSSWIAKTPEMRQRGVYYSFWKRARRQGFSCLGHVRSFE